MSIQRFETGPRMSQVVVHGNTVYLAGVVAQKTAGESVTKQTEEILSIIDGHLAKAGTDKSKLLSATIYLTDIKTFGEMNAVWDGWPRHQSVPRRPVLRLSGSRRSRVSPSGSTGSVPGSGSARTSAPHCSRWRGVVSPLTCCGCGRPSLLTES